jgi:hypothetical protein
LHGFRAFRADEFGKFAEQGTFRRFPAEGEPGDPDHHDKHRREREYRVIGDCRTHGRGMVVEPAVNGLLAQANPS